MKKITLSLVALCMAFTINAQTDVINRSVGADETGLISTEGNDNTAVYTADYFEITSQTAIAELDINGFGSLDVSSGGTQSFAPNVLSFNVWIFADNNGVPAGDPVTGGELIKLESISASNYNLTDGDFLQIDLTAANGGTPLSLNTGSYWISVFPSVSTAPTGNGRWNWLGSDDVVAQEAKLIDPNDLFQAGATAWTSISTLTGEPFPSFAWVLRDATTLAVAGNSVKDFNHFVDANNTLNISSNLPIKNVNLYNVLGQRVKNVSVDSKDAQINLNGLNSGVYLVQTEVDGKSKTFKIVKK